MKRVHLLISGRVQGVCFRDSTAREASKLGVCGWVRNIPMGQVEVVAEGKEEDLERFISWCYEGPPLAQVIDVKIDKEDYRGDFLSFLIT